ncbi:MAG TPA: hypothetical protein VM008_16145 [Phycisphaerae bacterium]|nr:hypothetical protein [Phycisphaerae bacterium]
MIDQGPSDWQNAVARAFTAPGRGVECPICHAESLLAEWHVVNVAVREAVVDARCSSCHATKGLRVTLPSGVPDFFPPGRKAIVGQLIRQQFYRISQSVQEHLKAMPAAAFTTHELWAKAKWSGTTFHWHPTSEAPPIMGIVFDDAEAGLEIFREAERQMNHSDRFEEIRVSIIEGPMAGGGMRPGYSVHICADPEALAAHATAEDFVVDSAIVPFLGQWNRHYPVPGVPELLPAFKREFAKHKEFLLAPVVRKPDGQLWVEPKLGIIKNEIHFRMLSEITPEDPDAAAILLPHFIVPPG